MGSFMLLVSTIMINLFPTVIIENFESTMQREEWSVHPSVLEEFIILWGHYDDGSGTIDPKQLEELLIDLGPPLGVRRGATSKELIDVSGWAGGGWQLSTTTTPTVC